MYFFQILGFVFMNTRVVTGHGGSRAAEFLKEHLFENLMKHPQFIIDTKLAISESSFRASIVSTNILFSGA